MPYTMKGKGIDELNEMLTRIGNGTEKAASKALYKGAGVMADRLKSSADAIQTAPFKWASRSRGETRLSSPEEKAIVEQGMLGIAKFEGHGNEISTAVGYRNAGYAKLKDKVVPIPKIMNAINSGTSFMKKQPFFRKGVRKATPEALKTMKNTLLDEIEALKDE